MNVIMAIPTTKGTYLTNPRDLLWCRRPYISCKYGIFEISMFLEITYSPVDDRAGGLEIFGAVGH